ncbi:MAG: hypothetical protein AB7O24_25950 [Kofleriaceae bacterium]
MIRRLLPHLSMVALVGGLAVVSWQSLRVLQHPPTQEDLKLHSADRVLGYRVHSNSGPRFLLDGGKLKLRMSSSALVSLVGGYDPAIDFTYRIRLSISLHQKPLWQSDIAITSRQSKADLVDGVWSQEGTWSQEGLQFTDERITIVDLPEVPVDSILELRLVGDGEAVVRAFLSNPRDAAARERAALRWDDQLKAELLRSSTYVPWSLLEPMEQDHRLRSRWQRLSALGEDGVDFQTRTVFFSGFRAPQFSGDAQGIELSRERAIAVNVLGPARLAVAPLPGSITPFRVQTVGAKHQEWASGSEPLVLDVGAGVMTVLVTTDSPEPTLIRVRADHKRWIIPDERRVATPTDHIVPDRVRIPLIVVGPNTVAKVPVYPPVEAGLLGRALRVDARLIGVPSEPFAMAMTPATITVTFRGGDGSSLGSDTITVTETTSKLDRVEWIGTVRAVAEPATFRLIAPVEATAIEVSADRDVAVSFYRWFPGPLEREQPYTDPPNQELTWRYAPLLHRSWYAAAPTNHEQLARDRRLAQLEAQVRLDVKVADDLPASLADQARGTGKAPAYESLRVLGAEQQRGREAVDREDVNAVVREWEPGALTELALRTPRMLEFRPKLTTRPRVTWAAPSTALGSAAVVTIDGKPTTIPLGTIFGSAQLPPIGPGTHRVSVDAPAKTQVWINRPPATDRWGIYRDRTLYALGRRPVTTYVSQAPGEQIHIYAVVYAWADSAVRVRLTIDGGKPKRREGVTLRLSDAEVEVNLPPTRGQAARLIDLGGTWAGTPRVVHLGLLDDLAPGNHRVDVAVLEGPPSWIRLVATRHAPAPNRPPASTKPPAGLPKGVR